MSVLCVYYITFIQMKHTIYKKYSISGCIRYYEILFNDSVYCLSEKHETPAGKAGRERSRSE